MSMSSSFRNARKHKLKAEINVVPFIDVMLVLLIIFMITAPLIKQGVEVKLPELPEGQSKSFDQSKVKAIVITVKEDAYYIVDQQVSIDQIAKVVQEQRALNPSVQVLVKGDQAVLYQKVISLIGELKTAGINDAGLLTNSSKSEKR